jgi:hypothetical protein
MPGKTAMHQFIRPTFLLLSSLFLTGNIFAGSASELDSAITNTALHKSGVAQHHLITIEGPVVRMAIFTPYDGYKASSQILGATIWATVEPELKRLCKAEFSKHKNMSHEELSTWLAKLLGLSTKNASARQFVIIDAPAIQAYYGSNPSKIGIFRPCTDPRISAHRDSTPACPKMMDAANPYIASDYKTWFINNSIASFTLDGGLPWTEYGYTYNWNADASNTEGASEFVILKNTPITVLANPNDPSTAYISPEEYCGLA